MSGPSQAAELRAIAAENMKERYETELTIHRNTNHQNQYGKCSAIDHDHKASRSSIDVDIFGGGVRRSGPRKVHLSARSFLAVAQQSHSARITDS